MEFVNEMIVGCSVIVAPLIQAVIKPFLPDSKYYPLISILLGELFGLAFYLTGQVDIATAVISGIVCGLAASGLYGVTKSISK